MNTQIIERFTVYALSQRLMNLKESGLRYKLSSAAGELG